MISNIIKMAANKENTDQLRTFWLKKYTELTENNYFVLSPKTIELTVEKEITRPATPFGDLILMSHLDDGGEINENLLQNNIEIAIRLLDACLDVIAFDKNSTKIINQYRKIGLGIADFGQYYKNLKRETNEVEEIEYVGNLVSNNAYRSSESLSEEKGICQNWDNIKKILRDKPFEYWYNTENGDIKTSTEMVANFDQGRVEASDFEIVPRRNSHIMLLPAVDEWQVWSDRSPMTISQLNSNSSNNSNSQNNLESKSNVANLNQSKFNDKITDGIAKSGTTIISFPKNKIEKLDKIETQNTQDKILSNEILKAQNETENELQNETNLSNLSNSSNPYFEVEKKSEKSENKLEHKGLLELETELENENLENVLQENNLKKTENSPELEMQNSQNFFEKPTNLEKDIEQIEQNSQNLEIGKIEENNNKEKIENEIKNADILENSKDKNDKSLIGEMVSTFGQQKFVELGENKDKMTDADLENSYNLEQSFEQNPLHDEFQLGELVRIVKHDSPSFGQIQQIIEIENPNQSSDNSDKTLKLSGFENQNLVFGKHEIEPVDLHDFLDQTNIINQKLAGGENYENLQTQNNIQDLGQNSPTNLENLENSNKLQELSLENEQNLEKIASLEKEIENLNVENENLDKIQNLETDLEDLQNKVAQEKSQNQELSKTIQSQKAEIDELKEELNFARQELKNVPNSKSQNELDSQLEKFGQNFGNVNFANLSSNNSPSQLQNSNSFDDKNQQNDQSSPNQNHLQNHAQELQNLLRQNNSQTSESNPQLNFTNTITNNFFKLQNKFISFMSKYSLQLQQLASTKGQFNLGDILITLQYDGSGVKLVSASGDQLSKELKHMVDTVLGIVNKALAFGVPADELAKQMKLEPKDDETETALNHILAVVAAALEEAPGQIQNLKSDSLFGIDKKDVEAFTATTKSDSMSILMSKLQQLKSNKQEGQNNISNFKRNSENEENTNPQFQANSDQKFEPKVENDLNNSEENSQKPQNDTNPFARNDDKNDEENTNSSNQNTQNIQNEEEKPKQEEKPRSFFGGFGGRN